MGFLMIAVLIVNYNTPEHLQGCLRSLETSSDRPELEVVVVNNGEAVARDELPRLGLDLRVVNNQKNVGYGAALNQAARLTRSRNILCLNADTRLSDGCARSLADFLERHPQAGVVAPRLVYPDGSLHYSCRRDYSWRSILGRRVPIGMLPMIEPAIRHHLMLDEDHDSLLKPDWVQGSCMMITRSIFEQIGGFDERFFLYFEDYDLCKRVSASGHEIVYLPESEVIHYYARSSARHSLLRRERWHHMASAIRYFHKGEPAAEPVLHGGF
jgi:GT2 family glycosyltransferase